MMCGVDGDLDIVADNAGTAAAGRHRAGIGIGQRVLTLYSLYYNETRTHLGLGKDVRDFHVCLTCGAIPIVTCMIEGIRYAVFNVDTFDDVDRSEFVETATNFEGETTENRLARRRRNWTPENIRNGGAKLR
jgi:hypothetical protein